MSSSTPKFVQGIFPFNGQGYEQPQSLEASAYTVPNGKRAQLIYLRAGNSSSELVFLALHHNGKLMRYFPIGARAASHVPLAVVEDIQPGAKLEVFLGAPRDVNGTVVLDIGLIEV